MIVVVVAVWRILSGTQCVKLIDTLPCKHHYCLAQVSCVFRLKIYSIKQATLGKKQQTQMLQNSLVLFAI